MIQAPLLINDPCKGHLRSPEVTYAFLLITFDREELEECEVHQCVGLLTTYQLICNMTYSASHVTLN